MHFFLNGYLEIIFKNLETSTLSMYLNLPNIQFDFKMAKNIDNLPQIKLNFKENNLKKQFKTKHHEYR